MMRADVPNDVWQASRAFFERMRTLVPQQLANLQAEATESGRRLSPEERRRFVEQLLEYQLREEPANEDLPMMVLVHLKPSVWLIPGRDGKPPSIAYDLVLRDPAMAAYIEERYGNHPTEPAA